MQAIAFNQYGSPDELKLQEVEKPVPRDGEILIKVAATSINSWDLDILVGDFVNRVMFGLRKPGIKALGADIAGRVEAVGKNVARFRPGDEVWGDLCEAGWGGLAEYVAVPEKALALKPANISFTDAAAVPQAALLALQGIRDIAGVKAGQKVLINGAGGGVGTYALQMAKNVGAEVTAVDSAGKLALLRSIGADHVIDFAKVDFTATGACYDVIFDVRTNRPVAHYARALNHCGIYVTVGGATKRLIQTLILGGRFKKQHKQLRILAYKPNKGLDDLKAMIEAGQLKSVVDGPYPLEDAAEAFRHFITGAHLGKVVIAVGGTQ